MYVKKSASIKLNTIKPIPTTWADLIDSVVKSTFFLLTVLNMSINFLKRFLLYKLIPIAKVESTQNTEKPKNSTALIFIDKHNDNL